MRLLPARHAHPGSRPALQASAPHRRPNPPGDDAQRHKPTGVIDFSSAGPDDPAVDFAAASTLGPDILAQIAATYPAVHAARDRLAFYKGTFALQEALFGIEHNDMAGFRVGLEEYT